MRVRPAERQCSRARGKAGSGSSTKSQTANAFARPRTGARNDVCGNLAAQRKNLAHRSCMPARKNSFAYSALRGRARFATASTRQRSAPAETERKMGRDRTCSKAMCPERAASYESFASRTVPGRTRLSTASTNQRSAPAAERKKRGRTGGPALVCPQQRSAPAAERKKKGHGRAVTELQLRGGWCSGITPAQHARGACPCPCAPASVTVCLSLVFLPLGVLCVLPTAAAPPRQRHF